jgi:hypothetical protein
MKTAIVWMLITVSHGAEVHHDYYKTEQLCEEAKSLALTGMTRQELAAQLPNVSYQIFPEAAHAECIRTNQP